MCTLVSLCLATRSILTNSWDLRLPGLLGREPGTQRELLAAPGGASFPGITLETSEPHVCVYALRWGVKMRLVPPKALPGMSPGPDGQPLRCHWGM